MTTSAEGAHTWPGVLSRLMRREDLPADATAWAMDVIMSGEATSVQIAGFAVAEADELYGRLTRREQQIAALIADGLDNEEIAERLSIAETTVKTHVSRILAKLGVRQRAAVAAKIRPLR